MARKPTYAELEQRIRVLEEESAKRKRAEDELRESEERYRNLVEESFDGIFIQKGAKILFANQRLYEMLHYPEGELEGLDHWLVYHPDYQHITKERAQALMRGEEAPPQYEVKLQRRDSTSFDGEIRARAIRFGNEPGIQVWVRDITERKQAEEALRESEERFRSIFENAVEGIYQSTPKGRFIAVNPAAASINGYASPEEMVAEVTNIGAQLYVQQEDRERYRDLLGKQGMVKDFETQLYRKDGSKIWVSLSTREIRDTGGNLLYYEGIVEDITYRKRAAEALQESEERFRLLYDNSADGILLVTPEGRIIAANPAACRMFGRTEEELRQVGRAGVVDLSDPRVGTALEERERKGMFRSEYYHLRKDGTRFLCEVTSNIFRDKDGQIRASVILRDITERKRAEEALEEERRRLQKALDDVRTLRGIVPICASCKKIRDDKGYWNQVEKYVSEHSEAQFSHGICPECLKKLYPEFAQDESQAKS